MPYNRNLHQTPYKIGAILGSDCNASVDFLLCATGEPASTIKGLTPLTNRDLRGVATHLRVNQGRFRAN